MSALEAERDELKRRVVKLAARGGPGAPSGAEHSAAPAENSIFDPSGEDVSLEEFGRELQRMRAELGATREQQRAAEEQLVAHQGDARDARKALARLQREHAAVATEASHLRSALRNVSESLLEAQYKVSADGSLQTYTIECAEVAKLLTFYRQRAEVLREQTATGAPPASQSPPSSPPSSPPLPAAEPQAAALAQARPGILNEAVAVYQSDIMRLRGATMELRDALDKATARERSATRTMEQQRQALVNSEQRVAELERLNRTLREAQPAALPDGVAPSSMDIIATMSEQLIQVTHTLRTREAETEHLGSELARVKRDAVLLGHRQALLYKDHATRKAQWDATREALETELQKARQAAAEGRTWRKEHEALTAVLRGEAPLDALENADTRRAAAAAQRSDPDNQLRQHLGALGRRVALLAAEAEGTQRRTELLVTSEEEARRRAQSMADELASLEAASRQRIDYLERGRAAAHARLRELRSELAQSVPQADVDRLSNRAEILATRYRLQLERYNSLQQESLSAREAQLQLTERENQLSLCQRELELVQARLKSLQPRAEGGGGNGGTAGNAANADSAADSAADADNSHKVAIQTDRLEHEKQRASLLAMQRDQAQQQLLHVQQRNASLEGRLDALAEDNLRAKEKEAELRAQASNLVPVAELTAKQAEVAALHEKIAKLEDQASALRERADIAVGQADAVQRLHRSDRKEAETLRAQLLELHVTSDLRTALGRLHHRNLALQMAEAEALRRCEQERRRSMVLQRDLKRLETDLQRRDASLDEQAQEGRSRAQHLRSRLQALRLQYAGAAPLDERERLAALLEELRAGKRAVAQELLLARQQREEAEDDLKRLREQHAHLQELVTAIGAHGGDPGALRQAREWHAKLGELRLENMRLERELLRSRERVRYLERVGAEAEDAQRRLEGESVSLRREHEEQEAAWEHREAALERALAASEAAQARHRGLAAGLGQGPADDLMPDDSKSVGEQLEEALYRLRQMHGALAAARSAAREAEERTLAAEMRQKEAEARVAEREAQLARVGAQAAASGLSEAAAIATAASASGGPATSAEAEMQLALANMEERYGRAVSVAQGTIESLQRLLDGKDAMLTETRAQLSDAHAQLAQEREAALEREGALTRELHALRRRPQEHRGGEEGRPGVGHAGGGAVVDRLQARVSELQDEVALQRQQLQTARQTLNQAEAERTRQARELRTSMGEVGFAQAQAETHARQLAQELQQAKQTVDNLRTQLAAEQARADDYKSAAQAARQEASEASLRLSPGYASKIETLERQRQRGQAQRERIAELEALVLEMGGAAEEARGGGGPPGSGRAGGGRAGGGRAGGRLPPRTSAAAASAMLGRKNDGESVTEDSMLRRSLEMRRASVQAEQEEHAATVRRLEAEVAEATRRAAALEQTAADEAAHVGQLQKDLHAEEALRTKAERDARRQAAEVSKLRKALEKRGQEVATLTQEAELLRAQAARSTRPGRAGAGAGAGGGDHAAAQSHMPEAADAASAPAALQKWAADKKLQKRLESAKARLAEREEELSALHKQLEGARVTVGRMEREREQLTRKLQVARRSAAAAAAAAGDGGQPGETSEAAVQRLQAENRALRRRLEVDAAQEVARRDVELRELQERLAADGDGSGGVLSSAAREVVAAQGEVLELRFRVRELEAQQQQGGGGAGGGGGKEGGQAGSNLSEKLATLTQENRRLRRERQQLQEAQREAPKQTERALAVLNSEHERLKALYREEREAHEQTGRQAAELREAREAGAQEIARLQRELRTAGQPEVSVTAMYESQLQQLREQDARKAEALQEARKALAHAAEEETRLRAALDEAEAEAEAKLAAARRAERKGLGDSHASLVGAELALVKEENQRLRDELAAFDPQFFEEIEDLKFNYQMAREALEHYVERYGRLDEADG